MRRGPNAYYPKPTWRLIQDALNELPELFTFKDLANWFRAKYPKLKETGIRTHVIGMTVNGSSGQYYPRLRPHAVLYRVKRNHYTRYDPQRHGEFDIYGRQEGAGGSEGRGRPGKKTNVSCSVLAAPVLARYSPQRLKQAAKRFSYRGGDLPFPFFDCFRARGHMSKEQLVWIVDWKTAGRQRKNAKNNSEDEVEEATQAAFQAAASNPAGAAKELARLKGVRLAVASALLTAWDPQRFGILDIRVWRALHKAAPDAFRAVETTGGNRLEFRLHDFVLYLCVIREISTQTQLSCREIDKALWVLGEDP